MDDAKERGRRAYAARAWADAFDALSRAHAEEPLAADDAERLAFSASLSGHGTEAIDTFERVHQLRHDAGDLAGAARAAVWAALRCFSLGETARGGGWVARAQRVLERHGRECVETGYVRLPIASRLMAAGDVEGGRATAKAAGEIAERYGDPDLAALAASIEARALIRNGRLSEGLPILDETMVGVTSGAVSPAVAGIVYCSAIAICRQTYALERAREWTAALARWCDAQPQLVAFTGQCHVHRSEVLLLAGAWPDAAAEARHGVLRLGATSALDVGDAIYLEAEIHRLRGELSEAEEAYARASDRGRDPQPGLAMLRLAQGRIDLAVAASRRLLAAVAAPIERVRHLFAHVEIMISASEIDEARRAADELSALAISLGVDILGAMGAHARALVALADGEAASAIEPLKRAQDVWQRVGAPYEVARIRVARARACGAMGDRDGARLELEAAKKTFEELGARPDLDAIAAVVATTAVSPTTREDSHPLSVREVEVLRLIALGKTNKIIARELSLSERTVDRHVSNIFTKLNVPTRAAATAWAFHNGVVG